MNSSEKGKIIKNLIKDVTQSEKLMEITADDSVQEEIIDLGNNFNFDGFQVVRREFFAHLREPSATFNSCKFSINSACLQRFPNTSSVQVLINKETKIMALMPCPEGAKDSFIWCKESNGKRSPKQATCKLFFAKIVDMMGWNPDYKYKMLGKLIKANGEMLIAFDLSAAEVYQRTFSEDSKPKISRTPYYPAEWQNQFGLPYNEHKQSMQINIFDGYAVYSIKDSISESDSEKMSDQREEV